MEGTLVRRPVMGWGLDPSNSQHTTAVVVAVVSVSSTGRSSSMVVVVESYAHQKVGTFL